jgi:hypothetical protein
MANSTGGRILPVAPSHPMLRGSDGFKKPGVYSRRDATAYVDRTLPPDQYAMAAGHELAHHIETVGGYMPLTRVARKQLENVYSTLATGEEWRSGGARSLPKDYGYSKGFPSDRELVVEGMRAYWDNPNAFKAVAPDAAELIRKHFNNNPKTNRTVQFNTIGGGLGLGASTFLNQPPSDQ